MGLRITVDTFSGRANPTWEIQDQEQVHELIQLMAHNQAAVAEVSEGDNSGRLITSPYACDRRSYNE